jgi:putative addiction module component (TIGR02574 family)
MTILAERVVQEALQLDEAERADVAAAILESLEAPGSGPDRAWLEEVERRAERAIRGESAGAPWEEVRDQLAAGLKR